MFMDQFEVCSQRKYLKRYQDFEVRHKKFETDFNWKRGYKVS